MYLESFVAGGNFVMP